MAYGRLQNRWLNGYSIKTEMIRLSNEGWENPKKLQNRLKRGKKLAKSDSIYDAWELQYAQNKLRFTFYLIFYLFFDDDGFISDYEDRYISKLVNRTKGILRPEQFNEISTFADQKITLDDLSNYVKNNKLEAKIIQDSITDVREYLRKDSHYLQQIRNIESTLL